MDLAKKTRCISNSYYNLGLERARIRDLTGAAESLKKSLHFNKYHMDARNLLGLIYYEIGEVAEALTQWVISMNLQPDKNIADHYLDEIQRKAGRLEAESSNVRKYNQALLHARAGSDDLAVLQLTRVIDSNSHFIKAHLLLALLYMSREDFTKAGSSLYKVLKIDKNNPKALWYMSIVKENTGKADIEKKKLKNAFSHRQMQDDDIILPPTYKENTGWQTILNIIVGLGLGAAVIFFLVMPANTRAINSRHNQEMLVREEMLNTKSLEIGSLTKQMEALQEEKDQIQETLSTIETDNGSILGQYQALVGILQSYRKDDFKNAVKLYAGLDISLITDENILAVVKDIEADMKANGYQILETLGKEAAAAGDPDTALVYYQKSLDLKGGNAEIIFQMAMIYKGREDKENANRLFGEIIKNFPDTELAKTAKDERGF